jgi:hypothetical protein
MGILPVEVACNERPLWVDGGPSFIVREAAAVGGEETFAGLAHRRFSV